MGQIININIGRAAIPIGQRFIDKIANEHFSLEEQKRGKSYVFFNEKQKAQQSRSIFIDMDSRSTDKLTFSNRLHKIKAQNIVSGFTSYSDVYASARSLNQSQLITKSFEALRKQTEACDLLTGYVISNSLDCSTGGLNKQILQKVRQCGMKEMPAQTHNFINTQAACSPIQVYNQVLSIFNIIQNAHMCILSQNKACINRLQRQGNLRPTISQTNDMLAQSICETTAPYRFGGSINCSQLTHVYNLIMFQRMKFMVSSFSNKKNKLSQLQCALKPQNFSISDFFANSVGKNNFFTIGVHCRDNFGYQEQINNKVNGWMAQNKLSRSDWTGNDMHISISDQINYKGGSSTLINSRYITKSLSKLSQNFAPIYQRRSYLHNYTVNGIELDEFRQAESNLNDLISQYEQYQDHVYQVDQFQ